MFEEYENDFLCPVRLPDGSVIYRLEEDEAMEARAAVRENRPIPPPKHHRLLPFGQGVRAINDHFECRYGNAHIGTFPSLRKALKAWDQAERHERYIMEQAAEQDELDKRYYGELTYDEDGYKVFTPRPSVS